MVSGRSQRRSYRLMASCTLGSRQPPPHNSSRLNLINLQFTPVEFNVRCLRYAAPAAKPASHVVYYLLDYNTNLLSFVPAEYSVRGLDFANLPKVLTLYIFMPICQILSDSRISFLTHFNCVHVCDIAMY